MTEQEWFACERAELTPDILLSSRPEFNARDRRLQFLLSSLPEGKARDRKLRLFGVACCRRVIQVVSDEEIRQIVDMSEAYADGMEWQQCSADLLGVQLANACKFAGLKQDYYNPGWGEAESAENRAVQALREMGQKIDVLELAMHAYASVAELAWSKLDEETKIRPSPDDVNTEGGLIQMRAGEQEGRMQSALLLDIFGNPFRPATIDPRWKSSTVIDLANAIYQDKAFGRMHILADALMDTGCDDEDIIAHCRSEGPHVRGCWVVDLLRCAKAEIDVTVCGESASSPCQAPADFWDDRNSSRGA